jgi:hypothetical protein
MVLKWFVNLNIHAEQTVYWRVNMRYMVVDYGRVEVIVRIVDTETHQYHEKNFYLYGTDWTYAGVLEKALEKAEQYGVSEIRVYEQGVGGYAYDYLRRKSHTACPWHGSVVSYKYKPL